MDVHLLQMHVLDYFAYIVLSNCYMQTDLDFLAARNKPIIILV